MPELPGISSLHTAKSWDGILKYFMVHNTDTLRLHTNTAVTVPIQSDAVNITLAQGLKNWNIKTRKINTNDVT
jgi:hypothetical protein